MIVGALNVIAWPLAACVIAANVRRLGACIILYLNSRP